MAENSTRYPSTEPYSTWTRVGNPNNTPRGHITTVHRLLNSGPGNSVNLILLEKVTTLCLFLYQNSGQNSAVGT